MFWKQKYNVGHMRCMHARPHRRKDQLPLQSLLGFCSCKAFKSDENFFGTFSHLIWSNTGISITIPINRIDYDYFPFNSISVICPEIFSIISIISNNFNYLRFRNMSTSFGEKHCVVSDRKLPKRTSKEAVSC